MAVKDDDDVDDDDSESEETFSMLIICTGHCSPGADVRVPDRTSRDS